MEILSDIKKFNNAVIELQDVMKLNIHGFIQNQELFQSTIDSFDVAMWIKDTDSKFIFANKACCDTILRCSLDEVLNMSDNNFEDNALAYVCIGSDRKTERLKTTLRFIEYGYYGCGCIFLDVIKSPIFDSEGVVYGTVGSAVDISTNVVQSLINVKSEADSIGIPLDTILCKEKLIEYLGN